MHLETGFGNDEFLWKIVLCQSVKENKKKASGLITLKKDYLMVHFLKRQILCVARKSVEASSETIWNLLLRILFWYRVGNFPTKYKGKDIRIVYGIIYLIIFAILSFMAAHSYVNAMESLGYW